MVFMQMRKLRFIEVEEHDQLTQNKGASDRVHLVLTLVIGGVLLCLVL